MHMKFEKHWLNIGTFLTAKQENLPVNEWKEMREMILTQESGFNQNYLRINLFQRQLGCVRTI